ncbi:MAG: xthA [Actinomycetia bacterium]|nr:xthA [Actinomycetes bacterium]
MRIATWNVNSLKARLPRVEQWLAEAQPDVLCLQETKLADDAFPQLTFGALGYESVHHGQGRWNGVAILSRVGIENVTSGIGDQDSYLGDARVIGATCGGVRVFSVYVPNGREVDTEFYERKLLWLDQFREYLRTNISATDLVAVLGDFNVAPEDKDVWSVKAFEGATHVTPAERTAVERMHEAGLADAFRARYDQPKLFSYWDYRQGAFHQHRGMRIDLVLMTEPLIERMTWALIDRNGRKGTGPSDHTPVFVDVDVSDLVPAASG